MTDPQADRNAVALAQFVATRDREALDGLAAVEDEPQESRR